MNEIIQSLSDIDTNVLLFCNGIHSPFWDYFMSAFTGKVIWVPMYATILYVLLKNFHWKVAICYVVAIALTITFADQMCNSLIRPLVGRLRPSNPENPIVLWAFTNSYTRLYLGLHYPGDLIVGAIIGGFGGWMLYFIFHKLAVRLNPASKSSNIKMRQTGTIIYVGLLTTLGIIIYSIIQS